MKRINKERKIERKIKNHYLYILILIFDISSLIPVVYFGRKNGLYSKKYDRSQKVGPRKNVASSSNNDEPRVTANQTPSCFFCI